MKSFSWIGAACGSGAQDERTRGGPAGFFAWVATQKPDWFRSVSPTLITERPTGEKDRALPGLVRFNQELSLQSQWSSWPLVVGGDHSCAIGTWSGVHRRVQSPLGMLWIDAHLDSHTPETTETGAIHGMPLAVLLGEGVPELTSLQGPTPSLDPLRTVVFGVRSFEPAEREFLLDRNVRIYTMTEIRARGFQVTWAEACERVTAGIFGISLDLDAMDPSAIAATGYQIPGGLFPEELLEGLNHISHSEGLRGFEIVEYNRELDSNDQTARWMVDCFGVVLKSLRPEMSALAI